MTSTFDITTKRWTNFEAWLTGEWRNVVSKEPSRVYARNDRLRATSGITPRGLNRLQVAALTGLSPTAFDKARRDGKYPGPTLPGGRYDRTLIERTMNRLSGIDGEETPASALDAWRNRGSR